LDCFQKLGIKSLEYCRPEIDLILNVQNTVEARFAVSGILPFNTYFVLFKANYNILRHYSPESLLPDDLIVKHDV